MISESSRSFNPNRMKPEFRGGAISTDVNMGWLTPLSRVEEQPVWPDVVELRHSIPPNFLLRSGRATWRPPCCQTNVPRRARNTRLHSPQSTNHRSLPGVIRPIDISWTHVVNQRGMSRGEYRAPGRFPKPIDLTRGCGRFPELEPLDGPDPVAPDHSQTRELTPPPRSPAPPAVPPAGTRAAPGAAG